MKTYEVREKYNWALTRTSKYRISQRRETAYQDHDMEHPLHCLKSRNQENSTETPPINQHQRVGTGMKHIQKQDAITGIGERSSE